MFGLGRIARCRPDAAIGLLDQLLVAELFVRGIAPILLAHHLMHALGKSFRQPVRQGAQQDGVHETEDGGIGADAQSQ